MIGPAGYGRYNDSPEHVGCPRAKSDMTPCVARDGNLAEADDGLCVGCAHDPGELLVELQNVTDTAGGTVTAEEAADTLRDLVRKVTEPV